MTIEDSLKEYILERYKSVREFTILIDIPYTTLDTIFKRGIQNSSIGNVIKICNGLHISADALADGKIVPYFETITPKFRNEAEAICCEKLSKLELNPDELLELCRYAEYIKSKRD